MRTLKVLALFILIGGATVLLAGIVFPLERLPLTGTISLSSQSEAAWQIPPDEVRAVFKQATEAMFSVNATAAGFKNASEWCTWGSFLCSALIAVVLGWRGRQVPVSSTAIPEEKLVGLPRVWAGVIGLLAALATVFTVGGSQANAQAETLFNRASALNSQISETQRALEAVPVDAVRQREALANLRLISERR